MSSFFNVYSQNITVSKAAKYKHQPELGFEPGRMLGSMLGLMFILCSFPPGISCTVVVGGLVGLDVRLDVSFLTGGHVHSMLDWNIH